MRVTMEKYQAIVYFVAALAGLAAGLMVPEWSDALEILIWPVLGVLLYAVFTQVPMSGMGRALADGRFFGAVVGGNFLILPFVAWALVHFVPEDPAIRLGVLMVWLVPCTDWFITFTQLGGGDTKRAVLFSPVSLLLQVVFLPVYLWLFLGREFVVNLAHGGMLVAFLGLIVAPLVLAVLTQRRWSEGSPAQEWLGWFPVPLLAVVIFMVAASQVDLVRGAMSWPVLLTLVVVFVVFLVAAGLLGRVLATAVSLDSKRGRVLSFSFGTRNSFVVLPLALALPEGLELAAVVIVLQSLVELFGMIGFLWWVPTVLFPESGGSVRRRADGV